MTFEKLQTPCFVFDRQKIKTNIEAFDKALGDHWGKHRLSFSVKTTPLPWLLHFLHTLGYFAEVVSDMEYEMAIKTGFQPSEIVFNGPIKGKKCFFFALEHGSVVNLDSQRELNWLEEYAASGKKARVGLRVNLNLELLCPGETLTGKSGGRFGYSYETGALGEAIRRVHALEGITLAGLHMHINSKSRSVKVYRTLGAFAVKLAKEYGLNLSYVDMGGGYFGGGKNLQAYSDYVEGMAKEMGKFFDPSATTLIVEPGGSVSCTPADYLARVVDVKDTVADRLVVTEASRLHIDHEMKKTSYVYELHTGSSDKLERQVICGYTCMETDRLMILENQPELQVGDLLEFHYTGAYTLGFCPYMFIDFPPVVYVKDGDCYQLVRKKWDVASAMQMDILEP